MVSDSVSDLSLFSGSPNSDSFGKNRSADWSSKTKQGRLDARRRKWLFHLKKGHVREDDDGGTQTLAYLRIGRNGEETDWNIESDADSWGSSSPKSVLTSKDRSSKSSDCFCCSGRIEEQEEEEVYDDAFDNFEGFTDALDYFENDEKGPSPETMDAVEESPTTSPRKSVPDVKAIHGERSPLLETKNSEKEPSKKRRRRKRSRRKPLHGKKSSSQEEEEEKWKQEASSTESTEPRLCVICCNEMDATDLDFSPCPCGFKLCLFCHKTISENNGRCPGCRKEYEAGFQQHGRGITRLSPSFRGLEGA